MKLVTKSVLLTVNTLNCPILDDYKYIKYENSYNSVLSTVNTLNCPVLAD